MLQVKAFAGLSLTPPINTSLVPKECKFNPNMWVSGAAPALCLGANHGTGQLFKKTNGVLPDTWSQITSI